MNIISIIVCTYNQEGSIRRCLDAILSQESPWQFEVIIGDDDSRDSTRSICEEYERRYPGIVCLMPKMPNKGVVQNYYDCVRAARGKYIMECGGDDEWCPGRIKMCLDIMEEHPNVVQILTDTYYKEEKTGKCWPVHTSPLPFGMLEGKTVTDCMFHQTADQFITYAMTRRDAMVTLMERYPQFFNGRKYLAEDKQLKTLLGTIGDFYYINACTDYYVIDADSITHTTDEEKKYKYSKNMLVMTHDLAVAIDYKRKNLDFIFSHLFYVMLTRVFLSGKRELLDDARRIRNEYGIHPDTKSRLTMMIMHHDAIWSAARHLRSLITGTRR